ncbi:hypothetical protein [Parabacteroides massiliensis]|nr:hypothetical protein [Parabacteroides massiliensis]
MNIRQLNNSEYEKAVSLALDVFVECGSSIAEVLVDNYLILSMPIKIKCR